MNQALEISEVNRRLLLQEISYAKSLELIFAIRERYELNLNKKWQQEQK